MKIGKFETTNNLFLAPMAGYTDVAFRHQCKKFGAGLTTTEMVSAKGLIYDSEKTKWLLYTSPLEDIKVVQLFGSEPQVFVKAIQNNALKDFDIIDINMGCPAPKIVKNGEGSFLMTKPGLAYEIVRACVNATDKPITVKMRLGYEKNNAVEFAKHMESAGASAICVHGRLKTQGYSGEADYEEIAKVKQAVKIPVVANGDVKDLKSYKKILEITKADAVAIGRASIGNPYLFAELLNLGTPYNKLQAIQEQFDMLLKYYDEHFVVSNMRKQIVEYLKGMGVPNEVKLKLLTKESVSEVMEILTKIL
ncbi:MAG TPA: tRNA dihydrouridine synthase DusB [Clostridiales bacterium]|nr:tRNA dihydrouridine synthase DusB [Clostridiales bacterium]